MTNEQIVEEIQAGTNTKDNMLRLWEQNQAMVYRIARRFTQYMEIDDLLQQGFIALVSAAASYEPGRASFCTHAYYAVKGGLIRYLANCGHYVRLPVYMRELVDKYRRTVEDLQKREGRTPSGAELCNALSVNPDTLEKIEIYSRLDYIDSMDRPVTDDEDIQLCDLVPGPDDVEGTVIEDYYIQCLCADLEKCIADLPEDMNTVLHMRYLDGQASCEQVGRVIGKSHQWVRKLEQNAIRKLGTGSSAEILRGYLDIPDRYAGAFHGGGTQTFHRTSMSSTERVAIYGR